MTPEKATALRKPFPPESVGQLPKGGQMLDYVGHAAVTDRLLTVDSEWSWEPMALDQYGSPMLDKEGNLWIKLTICGVTRLGVGDGKSMKERVGDAIRNAAMRFGVALDLWAKENLVEFAMSANTSARKAQEAAEQDHPEGVAGPLIPPTTDKPMTARTRGQMFALFGELKIPEEQQRAGINQILGTNYASRADLTEDDAKRVIESLRRKKKEAAA